jgi:hypothetical protein
METRRLQRGKETKEGRDDKRGQKRRREETTERTETCGFSLRIISAAFFVAIIDSSILSNCSA